VETVASFAGTCASNTLAGTRPVNCLRRFFESLLANQVYFFFRKLRFL
jgi:hypothetical protein